MKIEAHKIWNTKYQNIKKKFIMKIEAVKHLLIDKEIRKP